MGHVPPQIVDIRAQLPRRTLAVPQRQLSTINQAVVHVDHRRRNPGDDDIEVLEGHANYHIKKNWASPGERPIFGDGLMYHYVVTPRAIYWCRDLTHAIWHARGANNRGLAVMLPAAFNQHIAPEQYALLAILTEHLLARDDLPALTSRAQVWGHGELLTDGNSTECPGDELRVWVKTYRNS